MTRPSVQLVLGVMFLLSLGGCAAAPKRADIPLGRWSGPGTFIYVRYTPGAGTATAPTEVYRYGDYPTELTIAPSDSGPSGSLRIEILSMRGQVEKMQGDRTHIVLRLEPGVPLAGGRIRPYRLAEFGLSLNENEPTAERGPIGMTHATCMATGDELVLQIHYMADFVDTYRFSGNMVYKDGEYFPLNGDVLVHWSEALRRE